MCSRFIKLNVIIRLNKVNLQPLWSTLVFFKYLIEGKLGVNYMTSHVL